MRGNAKPLRAVPPTFTKENVMSLDSSASLPSGNLGFLSAGVLSIAAWVGLIAFTLVALQGCAPTAAARSAKEPGGHGPSHESSRADEPPHSAPAERHVAERTPSPSHDHSSSRDHSSHNNCRRCSQ